MSRCTSYATGCEVGRVGLDGFRERTVPSPTPWLRGAGEGGRFGVQPRLPGQTTHATRKVSVEKRHVISIG